MSLKGSRSVNPCSFLKSLLIFLDIPNLGIKVKHCSFILVERGYLIR